MSYKTGIKQLIIEIFDANPKELFSIPDLIGLISPSVPSITNKAIHNILRTLRINKKIHRHKERSHENESLYGKEIDEKNIEVWVKQLRSMSTSMSTSTSPKKRKNSLSSKKEIQSLFADHYNNLASLEDKVMKIIDNHDILEKEMERIKNFLGK